MTPIYDPSNCSAAFQLNWAVSIFGRTDLPPSEIWIDSLKEATEVDGVRILEFQSRQPDLAQFFVSTCPVSAPSDVVRSIKGRWKYLIRGEFPSAFKRNYSITSVGAANSETLEAYVARQPEKHPMADDRLNAKLAAVQFHNPSVLLHEDQISSYGRFVYALQVVIENVDGWNETRDEVLNGSRDMIIRTCASKKWRLARIGLLNNHIHILLGCAVTESPESVALSILNNLAFAQGMKPAFRFSYYVGTFGRYDRTAIRRNV